MPEAKLAKGLLVIQGSTAADNVSVSLASGKVVVTFNGRQKQFAASAVNSMAFFEGLAMTSSLTTRRLPPRLTAIWEMTI